jgi:hypothetical protein
VKPVRRFAHGTDVPVAKTRGEIEGLLRKHGAAQILSGIDHEQRSGFVGFTLRGRQFRIPLLARRDVNRNADQVEREQWRALLLVVKAKLEFIAAGLATVEGEFLAHLVLPSGRTVATEIEPHIIEAYESGRMPPLLLPP